MMIGVALIAASALMIVMALSQPKIYVSDSLATTEIVNAGDYARQDASGNTEEIVINYPLDINTATVNELMSVNGLGEARASAIIEYREYLGGYTDVYQITEIQGFSESLYRQVAPYLTVE